jgi:hypothetical protein
MANFQTKKTGSNQTSWEYYIEGKDDWKRYETILKIEAKSFDSNIKLKKFSNFLYKQTGSSKQYVATPEPAVGISIYQRDINKYRPISKSPYKNGDAVILLDNKTYRLDHNGLLVNTKNKGAAYAKVKVNGNIGLIPINKLGKPKRNTTAVEDVALRDLNLAIKKRMLGNKGICIVVQNKGSIEIFEGAVGARTNKGTPKSDFTIIDSRGRNICYISHKAAGGAKAYQQYSGISRTAGEQISKHNLVKKSLKGFSQKHSQIVNEKKRYKYEIPFTTNGKELMNYAIYGPDYGQRNFGINNVNFIAQGKPTLLEYEKKKSDSPILNKYGHIYELIFSDGLSINGDLNHFKTTGYKPHILARYTAGRKFLIETTEYRGVRILIAPDALSTSKTTKLFFNDRK